MDGYLNRRILLLDRKWGLVIREFPGAVGVRVGEAPDILWIPRDKIREAGGGALMAECPATVMDGNPGEGEPH